MSASSVDKPAKNLKKSKNLSLEVDGQDPDGEKPRRSKKAKEDKATASTPVGADATESPEEPAKEKPRKKRKHGDGDHVQEARQPVEQPTEKKKKHRHAEEAVGDGVDDVQTEGGDSGRKKKKRRQEEAATEDGQGAHQQEGECGDGGDDDRDADASPPSSKKEKKEKRKHKQSEHEGEKAKPKEMSKKKRKRSSSSGFPDPSEDESLGEQSRKALEYAFAQFEDHDSWKFHKARQNWLLRNIWSDEAVPEKYFNLATRYLQGVQGGAREALIKSCRDAVEPSKPAASDAEAAEKGEIPPKSSEAEDPTTKRTVRFTVEEKEDHSIPSTTGDTKQQRAASILTALTS